MSARDKLRGPRTPGPDDRGVDPAAALARVAALLGPTVDSEARVLAAGVHALEALGLRGGLALLEPDGATLCFREVAWPSAFLRAVERLVGLRARGYRFDASASETYRRVLDSGATVYVEDATSVLAQLAPNMAAPYMALLRRAVGKTAGIYVPLRRAGRIVGTLNAAASHLRRGDVATIEGLAAAVSGALDRLDAAGRSAPVPEVGALVDGLLRGALAGESAELAVAQVLEWLVGSYGHARGAAWSCWAESGGPVEVDARGFAEPALAALRSGCALRKWAALEQDARETHRPCAEAATCCLHPGAVSLHVVAGGRMLGALCIDPLPGPTPVAAWSRRASALATALGVVLAKAHAERAAAEAQAGFVRAQRMEGLARLAGGVAHDFNNLLAVVGTTAELMRADLDPASPLQADLSTVNDACARGVRLTRQLLQWSRGATLHAQETDLGELALSMRPMLERLLGEDVRLEVEVAPDRALVLADPSALEQIIMNLVVNARDAMPAGGPLALRVSTVAEQLPPRASASSDAKPYVCLEVEDSGVGMDVETRARIFEPFFTTKDPERGTGLGLAVVDRVVREGGGWVEVDTVVGQGTTFTIWLPRITADGTRVSEQPSADAELPAGLHVLLVEDDDVLRASLARVLERAGCRVTRAATAAEARRAPPPAALVTDVILPDGNGIDLAAELGVAQPDLPVVAMSGYLDRRVRVDHIRERGHTLLVKPFRPAELVERLAEAVRLRSGPPPRPDA